MAHKVTSYDEMRMAQIALEKTRLREHLDALTKEHKELANRVELPFAVEINGHAVLVKKAQYNGGPPQAEIVKMLS